MSEPQITPAEIKSYQAHVGRTLRETDSVGVHLAARMAATLDRPQPERDLPPMWHFGLFQPTAPTSKLGHDGHPRRGDFLPPVSLPRRMFAGSDIRFLQPLRIGEDVTRDQRVVSVQHRRGRSGDLVFVRVALTLSQAGAPCIEEEQTIVYRGEGAPVPPVAVAPRAPLQDDETERLWTPNTVELFRYSAAIFVGHRIHYDWNYVTQEEGYPGIIVHGPLTATRLCEFAEEIAGRKLARFTFRGEAPLFADQEIRLVGRMSGDECTLRAERADGATAMSASATF
jgi:3-methylfumaryl-CoA hydratase